MSVFFHCLRSPLFGGLLWIAALLICAGCGEATKAAKKATDLEEGMRLLQEDKAQEAVAALDRAVHANVSDVKAHYYRAEAERKLDKKSEAVVDYEEALRLDAQFVKENAERMGGKATLTAEERDQASLRLAALYKEGGKSDDAMRLLTDMIHRNPKHAEAYCQRAAIFAGRGFSELAIGDLNEAVALAPNSADYLCARAKVFLFAAKPIEALNDAKEAVRIDPKRGEAYRIAGQAFASPKYRNPEIAIRYFNEAMRLSESQIATEIAVDLANAYCDMGEKLAAEKNEVASQKAFDQAKGVSESTYANRITDWRTRNTTMIAEVSPHTAALIRDAWSNLNNNLYDVAMQKFDDILRNDPSCSEAWSGRGVVFLRKKDPVSAMRDFDRAIRIDSQSGYVYALRAEAAAATGDYYQAERDASQAISLKTDSVNAYFQRAVAGLHLKKYDLALNDLREAVRLSFDPETAVAAKPVFSEIYFARGVALLDSHRWSEAIDDLSKSASLGWYQAGKINRLLAQAYRERGYESVEDARYSEAVSDLNAALKLDDMHPAGYVLSGLACCKMAQACTDRGDPQNAAKQWMTALTHFNRAILLDPNQESAVRARMESAKQALSSLKASGLSPRASL